MKTQVRSGHSQPTVRQTETSYLCIKAIITARGKFKARKQVYGFKIKL